MTTKTELKIEIDARHRYTINGRPAAGVTTVLGVKDKSAGLVPWAVGLAVDYLAEHHEALIAGHGREVYEAARQAADAARDLAADRGTQVHAIVEKHLRGEDISGDVVGADVMVQNGVAAAVDWLAGIGFAPLGIEVAVGSEAEMVAGTLDAIGACGTGDIALLDWKTGKGIYDTHYAQAATYARYWEQMNAERVGAIFIVRLDKETGAPEPHQVSAEMRAEGERLFAGCLEVYRSSSEMGKLMRRAK
jgi:hypothetical protein